MNRLAAVIVVLGCTVTPIVAEAQANEPVEVPNLPIATLSMHNLRSALLGLEVSLLVPRGDFAPGKRVAVGYGVRGAIEVGPSKIFDLGAAFRSVAHDSRTYDDTTEVKNMLRTLTVSGRVVAPLRHARPYVGASLGAAYLGTERMVERCCDDEGDDVWELDAIRMARFTPTASARIGLLVDVWKFVSPGNPVLSLDLGVEDHYGRTARYQTDGEGPVVRSGTNYRVFSLGMSVRTR